MNLAVKDKNLSENFTAGARRLIMKSRPALVAHGAEHRLVEGARQNDFGQPAVRRVARRHCEQNLFSLYLAENELF
jgi:hypothetical protein